MAAKWPPRSNSDQCTMVLDCSAKRRIGGAISRGKTATPVGTVDTAGGPGEPEWTASKYSRADEPAVLVSQYTVTLVSSWSRSTAPGSPPSVHSLNFSAIQASWPAGESVSA